MAMRLAWQATVGLHGTEAYLKSHLKSKRFLFTLAKLASIAPAAGARTRACLEILNSIPFLRERSRDGYDWVWRRVRNFNVPTALDFVQGKSSTGPVAGERSWTCHVGVVEARACSSSRGESIREAIGGRFRRDGFEERFRAIAIRSIVVKRGWKASISCGPASALSLCRGRYYPSDQSLEPRRTALACLAGTGAHAVQSHGLN